MDVAIIFSLVGVFSLEFQGQVDRPVLVVTLEIDVGHDYKENQ